jgi:hypothetical protein
MFFPLIGEEGRLSSLLELSINNCNVTHLSLDNFCSTRVVDLITYIASVSE